MQEYKAINEERKRRPRPVEFDQTINVTTIKVGIWILVAISAANLVLDNLALILSLVN